MPSPESGSASPLCARSRPLGRWRESIPARPYPPAVAALLALRLCLVAALVATLSGCAAGAAPGAPLPIPPTPNPQPTLATALAPAAAAATATPDGEEGPVTIVLWHAWYGEEIGRLLAEMAGRFHEGHPSITVEPVCVGDEQDVLRKTIAAIQAGNPPDMAVALEGQIAELVKANAVVPLKPYLDDPDLGLTLEEREDFFLGFWQSGAFSGSGAEVRSLPFAKSALAMYYNRTALKAAGISEPPKTWDEFEAACKAVSRGNARGLAWHEDASTFDAFLYSRGATQLDGDGARAIFNGPEGIESLDLLLRLGGAGYAWQPEGNDADRAMFAAGKAVFTFGPTSAAASYADAIAQAGSTFAWGATMLPQADASKPPRTVLSGADVCILQTSEARQRAAWQFLRWFISAEQSAAWSAGSGYAPVRRSAVQRLAESGWLDEHPVIKEACESVIPYAYPEPDVPGEREVRRAIEQAWVAALSAVKTPMEALGEAAAKANEALAAKR